ncbi:MAG: response regulator [Pseudomonadota bacterium]
MDITERKRAEEKIRSYQFMVESAHDVIFFKDLQSRYVIANAKTLEAFGLSKEKVIGKNDYEIMSDKEEARKNVEDDQVVFKTGKPKEITKHMTGADGKEYWFQAIKVPQFDDKGNIVGLVGIARDITEHKRAEEALKSQLGLEQVVAAVSTSFINLAPDQIDDGISRALETIGVFSGVDRSYVFLFYDNGTKMDNTHEWCAEGIEPQIHNLKAMSVDVLPWWMDRLNRFENIHIPRVADLPAEASAEKAILQSQDIQSLVVVPIVYGNSLLGFLGFDSVRVEKIWSEEWISLLQLIGEIFANALERKRAEEEKRELQAQLQQARKMEAIGTLAGGIAHDFNNILMGIQGYASLMLLDIDSSHPHYDRLMSIKKQVQSGARLTSQLLGYARKGRYEVESISLNKLVEETSETFGRTKKEITIHRELARDLSAIEADRGQIEQVLLNLYVNAADAMPGGGDLILKTTNTTRDDIKSKLYNPKPGNYVLLTVTDTGIGMNQETQKRIFDPFFTSKEMSRGTGLGLASAYGIIKGHDGYIDVESEKGRGTTFRIYLPATGKNVRKAVKTPDKTIKDMKGTGTVLLVDDEPVVLEVGKGLLEAMGYRVLTAQDGQEAIEIYREKRDAIDTVILDMVMPNMGGGETYDRLSEINPDIKVLLSSGYSIDGQATEILERGCNGFIQKPFDVEEMSVKIREIIKQG